MVAYAPRIALPVAATAGVGMGMGAAKCTRSHGPARPWRSCAGRYLESRVGRRGARSRVARRLQPMRPGAPPNRRATSRRTRCGRGATPSRTSCAAGRARTRTTSKTHAIQDDHLGVEDSTAVFHCCKAAILNVFACRAATIASVVNPPDQRPSASAATGDRCGARPRSTARMARARRSRRVQERVRLPDLTPNRTSRSSRARCPAASSGASRPLRDRQRADRGAGCAQDACSHHLQGSGWRVAHHFSSAPLIQECRRAATSPGWRRGKGRERSVCPFSWNGVSRE
jgi:hypothetical protein